MPILKKKLATGNAEYQIDIKLNPELFTALNKKYGPFDMELFASDTNQCRSTVLYEKVLHFRTFSKLHKTPTAEVHNAGLHGPGRRPWMGRATGSFTSDFLDTFRAYKPRSRPTDGFFTGGQSASES